MSCNCKNTDGFKAALSQARKLEQKTGEKHVVFKVKFQGKEKITFGTIKAAKDSGACCYFTTDGETVKISTSTAKKVDKKKVEPEKK